MYRNYFSLINIRLFSTFKNNKNDKSSIHSASINEIHQIPMKNIIRPLPSVLDEEKVRSIMKTIQIENFKMTKSDEIPPIDVLWYVQPNTKNNYFFAFGGCHRWEAYKRLNTRTIPVKLVQTTLDQLKIYFGSSLPNLK